MKQIGRFILIPFCRELNAVVEQSQVNTYVHGLLLLPCNVLVYESLNRRTYNRRITKAISHIAWTISCLIHVLTNILVTELTIAGTNLEHVNDIVVDGEELFLIETPTDRY